jgi:hypothetical protein
MAKTVKASDGYKKVQKEILKHLDKTGLNYTHCFIRPKGKKKPNFYCYTNDIAISIASYLETNKNIKTFTIGKNNLEKYIVLHIQK